MPESPLVPTEGPTPGRNAQRLGAIEAYEAQRGGGLVIDIRPARTRSLTGEIPGALVVAGPLREWRLGPDSPERVCDLGSGRAVVICGDGGAVSLLAVSALRGLGVTGAIDLEHGFPGWVAAGLPVHGGLTLPGRLVPMPESVLVA